MTSSNARRIISGAWLFVPSTMSSTFAVSAVTLLNFWHAGRLWFWILLNKNAVLREVKRLQLQVARLSSELKKPG